MKTAFVRVVAESASFRYPFLIRQQPTMPLPPPSTIFGLLSAAAGRIIKPSETKIGYRCKWSGREKDLEKIHKYSEDGDFMTTDILWREILWDVELEIYLSNKELAKAMKTPVYPLLLGRTENLAMTKNVKEIELERRDTVEKIVPYTLAPFPQDKVPGQVLVMPIELSETSPREIISSKCFQIVDYNIHSVESLDGLWYDPENETGVFIFDL